MQITTKISLISILLINGNIANAALSSVIADYQAYYYQAQGIPYFISGLTVSGVLANTHADLSIQTNWQQHIRNQFTNELSDRVDNYGDLAQYQVSIPIYLTALWLSHTFQDHSSFDAIGKWSDHSLRTIFLGAPQQALLTQLLGSGRPLTESSNWRWFKYNRAVSGHAFYGAVPLLNLAKQNDNIWIKLSAYTLSTLPALARINNNKHYTSQAFLGWWLAFSTTQIVWREPIVSKKPQLTWQLMPIENTICLGLNLKL
ncbi:MAG: hypothetical protein ACHQJ6_00025 [Candidatus Berkiellales bacterium]